MHACRSTLEDPTVHEVIDLLFGSITHESLGELVDRELANRRVLDEFCLHGRLKTRATGPRLLVHFLAGNIPCPGIVSICSGLLLRAANIVKMSSRDPVFPALFVESLREVDTELADCVTALEWTRADTTVTEAALADANAVIAYGDDHSINALRRAAPTGIPFLGYGHKVSFGVATKDALTAANLPALCEAAAFDASVYDQQGCLSPHVFFVEERGEIGPKKFCVALAEAMSAYQARIPRGPLTDEEAAKIAMVRTGYEFRSESDKRVAVWASESPNDWAVIYDDDPSFAPSCLNRMIFVKPVDGYKRVIQSIQRFASMISCVGVAPMDERAMEFAGALAKLGITRLCPIGKMQRPPLSWHHDGRPNLGDLVRWTDAG